VAASKRCSEVIVGRVIAAVIGWLVLQGVQDSNETRRQARTGAVCEDGTETSTVGNRACSGHGGVDEWIYADTSYNDGDGAGVGGQP